MMIAINHDLIFLLCNTNFNRVYIYIYIRQHCLSYICNSKAAANPCRFGKESKLILVTNVCVDALGSLHK